MTGAATATCATESKCRGVGRTPSRLPLVADQGAPPRGAGSASAIRPGGSAPQVVPAERGQGRRCGDEPPPSETAASRRSPPRGRASTASRVHRCRWPTTTRRRHRAGPATDAWPPRPIRRRSFSPDFFRPRGGRMPAISSVLPMEARRSSVHCRAPDGRRASGSGPCAALRGTVDSARARLAGGQ